MLTTPLVPTPHPPHGSDAGRDLNDGRMSTGNFSSSKFAPRMAGVERSEPPVARFSGGSLRSTPATLTPQGANLGLLNLGTNVPCARP
jgi:hypothetical protein